jgi:outer membrane protein OmpA-like peptidoglycan-associated protein
MRKLVVCAASVALACGFSFVNATINSEGQVGIVRTVSAKTNGKARLHIGIGADYQQSGDFVRGPAPGYGDVLKPDGHTVNPSLLESGRMLSSNLYMSLGASSFLDLALSLPFYYDWAGFEDVRDGGLGDLQISAKFLYPPPNQRRVFYQSLFLGVSAPTGMNERGIFPRHLYYYRGDNGATTFYSSELPNINPMMIWTFDFGTLLQQFQFQTHINIGGVFSTDPGRSNTAVGRIAIEYTPAEPITIFADIAAEIRAEHIASAADMQKDPLMISPGVRINAPAGIYILLTGDFNISPKRDDWRTNWNPGEPDFRYSTAIMPTYGFQFAFGWNGFLTVQDDDRDGIKNDIDRCPKDAEDMDGYEDGDGCPDPDNDKDGILDKADTCPDKTEDRDGFKDDDGCPDPDNDGDGIVDIQDQCPNVAEDFDGVDDKDGCPDYDNDRDAIPDSLDKCPNDPEDIDKIEDSDGCPDIDNDKDGIPDLKDKCPNEPETLNGFEDADGCPDEKLKTVREPDLPKQQILRGVQFKTGGAQMVFGSFQYLDPIVKTLQDFPTVEIEIRGHTDSIGKYEKNLNLSQSRAEAVRQYFISKGVNAGRVRAVGFGPSSPIADNRTADGRMQNRRIEIVRIK